MLSNYKHSSQLPSHCNLYIHEPKCAAILIHARVRTLPTCSPSHRFTHMMCVYIVPMKTANMERIQWYD